jgi:hypothetical protein
VHVIVHGLVIQESLEEEGYDEEEIEKKVDELRLELEAASAEVVVEDASFTAQETHQIAMRKEKKMEIFRVSSLGHASAWNWWREMRSVGCRYHYRRILPLAFAADLWCF